MGQAKVEFWRILGLMVHLEDDLCFETAHHLLLLRNDSKKQKTKKNNKNFCEEDQ